MKMSIIARGLFGSRVLLPVLAIAAFFVTLAVTMPHRDGGDTAPSATASNSGAPSERRVVGEGQLAQVAPNAAGPAAAAGDSNAPKSAPTPPPPDLVPEAPVPQEDLPGWITTHIGKDTATQMVDLRNNSEEALTVTVTATDPATGRESTVQTVIPGGEQKNLTKLGLDAGHGNQITVHSPPYRDLVTQIN